MRKSILLSGKKQDVLAKIAELVLALGKKDLDRVAIWDKGLPALADFMRCRPAFAPIFVMPECIRTKGDLHMLEEILVLYPTLRVFAGTQLPIAGLSVMLTSASSNANLLVVAANHVFNVAGYVTSLCYQEGRMWDFLGQQRMINMLHDIMDREVEKVNLSLDWCHTTSDGVNVNMGDPVWLVDDKNNIRKVLCFPAVCNMSGGLTSFSTEQAAKDYVSTLKKKDFLFRSDDGEDVYMGDTVWYLRENSTVPQSTAKRTARTEGYHYFVKEDNAKIFAAKRQLNKQKEVDRRFHIVLCKTLEEVYFCSKNGYTYARSLTPGNLEFWKDCQPERLKSFVELLLSSKDLWEAFTKQLVQEYQARGYAQKLKVSDFELYVSMDKKNPYVVLRTFDNLFRTPEFVWSSGKGGWSMPPKVGCIICREPVLWNTAAKATDLNPATDDRVMATVMALQSVEIDVAKEITAKITAMCAESSDHITGRKYAAEPVEIKDLKEGDICVTFVNNFKDEQEEVRIIRFHSTVTEGCINLLSQYLPESKEFYVKTKDFHSRKLQLYRANEEGKKLLCKMEARNGCKYTPWG